MGEEGGAAAFNGILNGWPSKALKISTYSSNPKNNFIIEVAAALFANSDWINSPKPDDTVAKECVRRANVLANELGGLFE